MFDWTHADSVSLICSRKWQETPDTVSFELESPDAPLAFNFKPGQFASLGFMIDGKQEFRAYSINSLPGETALQFTVKRVDGGLVSNFIQDRLETGASVTLLKPAGTFNCIDCRTKLRVTLISAGCGITPVMSMAKYWLTNDSAVEIDFIHMARSKESTIYFDQLELLDRQHSNFNLRLLLKDNTNTRHPQGRLDKEWLFSLSPDLSERTVFLCGPVGFMQDIQSYLQDSGFDMSHFYQESYTPEVCASEVSSNNGVADGEAGGNVQISVPGFGVELEAEHGSLLVEALEQGGLPIIAACRSGICGSCKCKVEKGSVDSTSKETLTEAEIEQGYVLACSSHIKSDVEVGF
jgi:NADH oxidoreductase Hcr